MSKEELLKCIDLLYTELCTHLDARALNKTLSSCRGRSERSEVFVDFLCALGSKALKYSDAGAINRRDKMCGVYAFDGKKWYQVEEIVVKMALKRLCTEKMGMFATEWLSGEKLYMSSVRDGAMLNPLETSKGLIGFENGVYDFRDIDNITYHSFDERMDVTYLMNYAYSYNDTCAMWQSFLSTILDKQQIELLQKFLGLGMIDRASMKRKVENSLWLVGPGGAGKSTIMNVVRYVYGDENLSGLSLGHLLSRNREERSRFMALAAGKTFNYCGEVQMEDMSQNTDLFKSLCSGEPQTVRWLGNDCQMCYDIPYLIFNMNRKPRSKNIDDAMRRRLIFITFKTAVREEDRDPELESKLKSEASGIRNWMLEGYRKFVQDGYKLEQTPSSMEETDLWMVENHQTVELFMRKKGYRHFAYTGIKEKSKAYPVSLLFQQYREWCKKWGYEEDVDVRGMGIELRRIGYARKRASSGVLYEVYADNHTI